MDGRREIKTGMDRLVSRIYPDSWMTSAERTDGGVRRQRECGDRRDPIAGLPREGLFWGSETATVHTAGVQQTCDGTHRMFPDTARGDLTFGSRLISEHVEGSQLMGVRDSRGSPAPIQ